MREPELIVPHRTDLTPLNAVGDRITLYALPVCAAHHSATDIEVSATRNYTLLPQQVEFLLLSFRQSPGTCGMGCAQPAQFLVECVR